MGRNPDRLGPFETRYLGKNTAVPRLLIGDRIIASDPGAAFLIFSRQFAFAPLQLTIKLGLNYVFRVK